MIIELGCAYSNVTYVHTIGSNDTCLALIEVLCGRLNLCYQLPSSSQWLIYLFITYFSTTTWVFLLIKQERQVRGVEFFYPSRRHAVSQDCKGGNHFHHWRRHLPRKLRLRRRRVSWWESSGGHRSTKTYIFSSGAECHSRKKESRNRLWHGGLQYMGLLYCRSFKSAHTLAGGVWIWYRSERRFSLTSTSPYVRISISWPETLLNYEL